jgi:predicted RNase H-like HicB family nuclease
MKFQVNIEQDESGYFFAEVPALPGCYSQGTSFEEASNNIKEAIIGWIEVMNSNAIKKDPYFVEVLV